MPENRRRAPGRLAPVALLASLVVPGCAVKSVTSPPDWRVDYELLPDPNASTPALQGRQVFMAPVALEAPLPEYPPAALANDAPPVTVVVRVIVSDAGAVREVLDSPLDDPARSDPGDPFRTEVERAVRAWRFRPAIIRTMKEGEDLNKDGKSDYDVVIQEAPVATYLDLRFTFEVVDGRGRVRTASGGLG
jgi:hypothetical protein